MALNQLEERGYVISHSHGGYYESNSNGDWSLGADEFEATIFRTMDEAKKTIEEIIQMPELDIIPAHRITSVGIG